LGESIAYPKDWSKQGDTGKKLEKGTSKERQGVDIGEGGFPIQNKVSSIGKRNSVHKETDVNRRCRKKAKLGKGKEKRLSCVQPPHNS